MGTRLALLALVFLGTALVLIARLYQVQVQQGARYAQLVTESRVIEELVVARRGRILDRFGTPLVDNRAIFNLDLVLSALEPPPRERRSARFLVLNARGQNALLADLGGRGTTDPATLRSQIAEEFDLHPAVGVRLEGVSVEGTCRLQALPRAGLLRLVFDPDPSVVAKAEALAGSGLLADEPGSALRSELKAQGLDGCRILDEAALTQAIHRLQQDFEASSLLGVVRPFAAHLVLPLPAYDDLPGRTFTSLLFTPGRIAAAEAALAVHLGLPSGQVVGRIDQALAACEAGAAIDPDWYFLPESAGPRLAGWLPAGLAPYPLVVQGELADNERILVIQDDRANAGRLFSGLTQRLAIATGCPATLVAASLDRHGEILGWGAVRRRWGIHPLVLNPVRLDRLLTHLSACLTAFGLGADRLELERRIAAVRRTADRHQMGATWRDPILLVRDVPQELAIHLEGQGGSGLPEEEWVRRYILADPPLPGLEVSLGLDRDYPYPGMASHLLGWLGRISSDPRTARSWGLDPQGWIGVTGLERAYDKILQGVTGRRTWLKTATGRTLLKDLPPVAGKDLRTTLDLDLQLVVEDSLRRWIELAGKLKGNAAWAKGEKVSQAQQIGLGRTAMVVADVHNGAILAMASTPGFDLSTIRTTWDELADPQRHPGRPLHDNAAWAAQPPGSTVKPLTGLATMIEGTYKPGSFRHSEGHLGRMKDHAQAGDYDFRSGLRCSSNVFFAVIGQELGPERLCSWFSRLGFGRNLAYDVPWARSGLLFDPTTIAHARPREPAWVPGDTRRLAIGQMLSASPLQLVVIPCLVANGGTVVRPHLWADAPVQPAERLDLPPAILTELRVGMEEVTSDEPGATASSLVLAGAAKGIRVAAKTGTSEWGTPASRAAGLTPDHAWLIGYAPADAPTVAFAIFVHSGTSGGRACSGVAKQVLEQYFQRYGRSGHRACQAERSPDGDRLAAEPARPGQPGCQTPGSTSPMGCLSRPRNDV